MIRGLSILFAAFALSGAALTAAEKTFDFEPLAIGTTPEGFQSVVAGAGNPGVWKVMSESVPTAFPPLTPNASVPQRRVLAQTAKDPTDEHFPILVYGGDVYGDFTFTTRFKITGGTAEQMAGIVFRYQDAQNFYVLRASAKDGNLRFYDVVKGNRGTLVGPKVEIKLGTWYKLSVTCKGNQIRCALDGKEVIPPLSNTAFGEGKVGFWTKSDSEAVFVDPKILFTPREPMLKMVIRETMTKYARTENLKIFARPAGGGAITAIAAKFDKDIGEAGGKNEEDVIARSKIYVGRAQRSVTVTMPLHDRNGETVAAARITMESFLGQTEENAIARALVIVKYMEQHIALAKDLYE